MGNKNKPYFLENDNWFYFDEEDWCFKLTDKAPKEAIESYIDFYSEEIEVDENGDVWVSD